MPTCLCINYGCFQAITAELSIVVARHSGQKAEAICSLAFQIEFVDPTLNLFYLPIGSLPLFSSQESGQVNVHARKVMQEENVIAASLAIRVSQPVYPVTVTQQEA